MSRDSEGIDLLAIWPKSTKGQRGGSNRATLLILLHTHLSILVQRDVSPLSPSRALPIFLFGQEL